MSEESNFGKNLLSLFLVVGFATVGGYLTSLLQHEKIKKHCSSVTIPILVGMIIFGCIARNTFGDITEFHYNVTWADWIR